MSRANLAVEREAVTSSCDISLLARLRRGYVKSIRQRLRAVHADTEPRTVSVHSARGWVSVQAIVPRKPRISFRFVHAVSEPARYFTALTLEGPVADFGPLANELRPWSSVALDDLVAIDAYLRRAVARGWVV